MCADYDDDLVCGNCGDEVGQWELDEWGNCEECAAEYDEEDYDDEPVEGDFTITPCGPLGGKSALGVIGGKFIGEFDCDESDYCRAREIMREDNYFPNVWLVSDHGNFTLYA